MSAAAVIIPTFNEARHIGGLLGQLTRLQPDLVGEILVADGFSQDSTRDIVLAASASDPRVRLIDNPDRIQSAGINRAAQAADPRLRMLVRMDAHSGYADDFVGRVTETLRTSRSAGVAVRLRTVGRTAVERGIAAASNSRFGTGGSAHRIGGVSGPVDHGHHAGFDRGAFDAVGGYDTSFVANEDAELDLRLRKAGGQIWLAGDIEVDYYPRSTFTALARQYWRYGAGRAQNQMKHGSRLRLRQLVPPVVLGLILLASLAAIAFPPLAIVPLAYLGGCAAAALFLYSRSRDPAALLAAPALVVMHMSWASAFLLRRLTAPNNKKVQR